MWWENPYQLNFDGTENNHGCRTGFVVRKTSGLPNIAGFKKLQSHLAHNQTKILTLLWMLSKRNISFSTKANYRDSLIPI